MRAFALLGALGLLAAARATAPAAAQEDRLAGRLDSATATQVLELVDSARTLSIPVEPLVQKAMEGATKGASDAAIVAAVRGLVRDLGVARETFGPDVPVEALQLGAAVLEAGATPAELASLRAHREKDAFPRALAGVVYLLSRGVPADASVGLVGSMLEAGLTRAEFTSLQRLVEQDVRGGVPTAEAATVRAQALIRHGPRLRPGGGGGG